MFTLNVLIVGSIPPLFSSKSSRFWLPTTVAQNRALASEIAKNMIAIIIIYRCHSAVLKGSTVSTENNLFIKAVIICLMLDNKYP